MVDPIPAGRRSITPHLVVKGAAEAIEFYKKAFGFEEVMRMPAPDGRGLLHAELKFGDSVIYLVDEFPQWGMKGPNALGGTAVTINLAVADIDTAFLRAVEAGATPTMQPEDTFWGDRFGKLKDPFGHDWAMATHVRDVAPEEMEEAMKKSMGEWDSGGSGGGSD